MSTSSYFNNAGSGGTNSLPPYKLNLINGDYIELIAFRMGGAGTVNTLPNGSWIKITKLL